jgi:uncharacterized OB-fold protein
MGRYMPDNWVLPGIDERTAPFFTTGKIMLQTCSGCGTVQHPPEDVCHRCQGTAFDYREHAGSGTIYSYTVVRHPVNPILTRAIPYVVVLVSLDDRSEVRITGNLLDCPPEKVRIGARVSAVWEEVADPDPQAERKLLLPQWKLAAG